MNTPLLRLFTRFTRVGIALVTVWCLGCGAFDPLIDCLTGTATSGMDCGVEQSGGSFPLNGVTAVDEGAAPGQNQTVAAPDQREPGSYMCSCESCYSVSPVTISLALRSPPAPEAIPPTPAFFENVKREPLVPPPQDLS